MELPGTETFLPAAPLVGEVDFSSRPGEDRPAVESVRFSSAVPLKVWPFLPTGAAAEARLERFGPSRLLTSRILDTLRRPPPLCPPGSVKLRGKVGIDPAGRPKGFARFGKGIRGEAGFSKAHQIAREAPQ